ncbi:MAG: DUF5615 family PIN-like protein [Phycisphaerales bacterium]|nr:DUF5615 family PIN-like protein [Phycisphaerales bacterium]
MDAQLSPALAEWIGELLEVQVSHVCDLRPRVSKDVDLIRAARVRGGIILSKDEDFVHLIRSRPSPPDLIWLRYGNRSDRLLRAALATTLPEALMLIASGERVVEIRDAARPIRRSSSRRSP